jgi:SAM-dependent methyltransferase
MEFAEPSRRGRRPALGNTSTLASTALTTRQTEAAELPLEWLACPVTKAPLKLDGGQLVAGPRRYGRHPEFGFWQLLPTGLPDLESSAWRTWEKLQANGVVSYDADPEHNLGVGPRADFHRFADFAVFHGTVLDVGVGPQRVPTHIGYANSKGSAARFVGLDPLVGEHPRPFSFVQGVAEYLPFQASVFDQVLFVTTLDHFIDPRKALAEAGRVLRPGGDVAIWIGDKSDSAPRPAKSHDWYESLRVPEGAHDRFHFKRFTKAEFETYLADVGFRVVESEVHEIDPWRQNLFYRVTRGSAAAK